MSGQELSLKEKAENRRWIAALVLQGFAAHPTFSFHVDKDLADTVKAAVQAADALIAELEKTKE